MKFTSKEHFFSGLQNLSSLRKIGWRSAEKIAPFFNMRLLCSFNISMFETSGFTGFFQRVQNNSKTALLAKPRFSLAHANPKSSCDWVGPEFFGLGSG
jgi:hypothetical protein